MDIAFKDTIGFTWQGEHLCLACTWLKVRDLIVREGWLTQEEAYGHSVHDLVGVMAARKSIPAYAVNEYRTYDTELFNPDDLPMAFEDADEGERCMGEGCGEPFTPAY